MKPLLFRIPVLGIPIYGFGAMLIVAVSLGLLLAVWRSRREKLDPNLILDLSSWIIIGGLVGARLLYVMEYWGETITNAREIMHVWEGGIAFYGSVIGAAAAFFLFRVFREFPVLATLDAIAPSIALGIAMGRIGCFLNGCCYGELCPIPWLAVRFPKESPAWLAQRAQGLIARNAPWSLPIHPTQLYSAVDGLIILMLLSAYYPIRRRDGEVIGLLMLTYPITRFMVDRLRDDETGLLFGMTSAQMISIMLLGLGLVYWSLIRSRKSKLWVETKPDG